MRLGILFPVYSVSIFCFTQYRKERDLEENYAHKASVATSLPNYANLAVDSTVKDQILSEAAAVIFTSPTKEKTGKPADKEPKLKEINELVRSFEKFVRNVKE